MPRRAAKLDRLSDLAYPYASGKANGLVPIYRRFDIRGRLNSATR